MTEEMVEAIEAKTDWTVAEVRTAWNADMVGVLLVNHTYSIWSHLTGLDIVEANEDPDALADLVLERAQDAIREHKLTIN
jgi:hypothetical protein